MHGQRESACLSLLAALPSMENERKQAMVATLPVPWSGVGKTGMMSCPAVRTCSRRWPTPTRHSSLFRMKRFSAWRPTPNRHSFLFRMKRLFRMAANSEPTQLSSTHETALLHGGHLRIDTTPFYVRMNAFPQDTEPNVPMHFIKIAAENAQAGGESYSDGFLRKL